LGISPVSGALIPILIMVFLALKARDENIMAAQKATTVRTAIFLIIPPETEIRLTIH
jgi:hypothetical protein